MLNIGPAFLMLRSPTDLLVVVVVVILLFGGKKIPELAKGLGEGIKNFKGSVKSDDEPNEPKKPEETR